MIPELKCLLYLASNKFTILEAFEVLIDSVVQSFFKVISDHIRYFQTVNDEKTPEAEYNKDLRVVQ